MIRVFLVLLLAALSSCQTAIFKCPEPWREFEDKCLKFELITAQYDEALEMCSADGAGLISVNSRREHTFIEEWFTEHSPLSLTWWTSGKREESGGQGNTESLFYWEGDGSEVQGAQYWLSDEDRTLPGTRIVYKHDGARWGWTLSLPDMERSFVCEMRKDQTYKILEQERGFDYGLPTFDPAALGRGPHFVVEPLNVIFDATPDLNLGQLVVLNNLIYDSTVEVSGKYAELTCEAEANPYPSYEWFHYTTSDEILLDPMTSEKYTISNGRLLIHTPEEAADNGDYQCKATNMYGSVLSRRATLRFGYLNAFPDTTRDPVQVNSFRGIGIECNPPKNGYATLSFSWYKNFYYNFIFSENKPHVFISNDGKLYFSSVTMDDRGDYVCIVAIPNVKGGKHSQPIKLDIIESTGAEFEPDIVNGFPKAFPDSLQRGDNLTVECIAYGSLPLEYTWSRDDGRIPPQAQYFDHGRVLNIPNIQVEQSGTYRCKVQRKYGQADNEAVVINVRAKPYFPVPLKDQHVDKGSDLTWRCYGYGMPEPNFAWLRDAEYLRVEDMPEEDRARFSIENNVLTILDVSEKDAGMYQCQATNIIGVAYSTAQLRVLPLPPTFAKYPLQPKQYATVSGMTTIICNPEAAPKAEVVWMKDGRGLNPSTDEGSRVRLLPNGNLHISKVATSDAGSYTCKASNIYGEAESTGNLTILSATTITYPPRAERAQVNSTAFLHCDASFNPALDLTYDWWHNNYRIEFELLKIGAANRAYFVDDPHYRRGTNINRGGLFIENVQFWHAGDYTCVAKTASGETSALALLEVTGPPSPPSGVSGNDVGTNTITLDWWPPGQDNGAVVHSYIVEAFNNVEGFWRRLLADVTTMGDKKTKAVAKIAGLSPGSQYRFRVRAINDNGVGEPSDATEQLYTTAEAPPELAPVNVRGGGGHVGDLQIRWDPLHPEEYNGEEDGVGYIVYWKKKDVFEGDKWENMVLSPNAKADRYVHNVGGENFYEEYDVMIQAYNNAGRGPQSDAVTVLSAENMPVVTPQDIKAVYHNSTAIIVYWTPVPNTREAMRGVLKGYRINYWKRDTEEESMALFRTLEGQASSGIILALSPNTYYSVNVQCYNTAGLSTPGEFYTTRTLRHAPMEAPQEVQVSILDHQGVEVRWRGVTTTIAEEPLEGYMIRYWKRGENLYVSEEVDAMKATRFQVNGLDTNVMYQLRVHAYSRGGVGLQSSPTIEFVLGSNCEILEDSPDKEYIYKCDGNGAATFRLSGLLLLCIAGYHVVSRLR